MITSVSSFVNSGKFSIALVSNGKEVQQRYMTKRILEGTSAEVAKKEADGITKEVIKKAKDLKKEQILKRHKVMEQIEARLPQVDGELAEVRGKMLTDYLEKHCLEIIAEAERYTLDELRAETEFYGTAAQKGFHETLLNCINESDITEQELELHTAEGIGEALNAGAETFNQLMIPGYAAWADGGTTTEIVASASSDVVLTLVGGKVVKIAWQGSKALYQGAAKLGSKLTAGEVKVLERQTWRQSEKYVGDMLGDKAREQISYLNGQEVRRGLKDSVRPDFIFKDKVAIEVKNYDIATNSDALIHEVVRQVNKRAVHLPEGMKQRVMIDVRGQVYEEELENIIASKIISQTNGEILAKDIKFLRK